MQKEKTEIIETIHQNSARFKNEIQCKESLA